MVQQPDTQGGLSKWGVLGGHCCPSRWRRPDTGLMLGTGLAVSLPLLLQSRSIRVPSDLPGPPRELLHETGLYAVCAERLELHQQRNLRCLWTALHDLMTKENRRNCSWSLMAESAILRVESR